MTVPATVPGRHGGRRWPWLLSAAAIAAAGVVPVVATTTPDRPPIRFWVDDETHVLTSSADGSEVPGWATADSFRGCGEYYPRFGLVTREPGRVEALMRRLSGRTISVDSSFTTYSFGRECVVVDGPWPDEAVVDPSLAGAWTHTDFRGTDAELSLLADGTVTGQRIPFPQGRHRWARIDNTVVFGVLAPGTSAWRLICAADVDAKGTRYIGALGGVNPVPCRGDRVR